MSSSTSSEWSEAQLVSHICLVCSQEFQQKNPILQYPAGPEWKNKIKESSKILDEFGIFYGLQCLNLSVVEAEKLFGNLVDVVGEPGNWCVSFCPYHSDIVKKGLELDLLIKRLQNQLKNIKTLLGNAILEDFLKEGVNGGRGKENVAFQMIRNQLKSAGSKPQPSESEGTVSNNKSRTASPRPRKKKKSSKRTLQECPDSTTLNSEFNDAEHKLEVELEIPAFTSPIANDGYTKDEIGDSIELIELTDEEEQQQWKDVLEHGNNTSTPANCGRKRQRTEGIKRTTRKRLPKESTLVSKKRKKPAQSKSSQKTNRAAPKRLVDRTRKDVLNRTEPNRRKQLCICKFCPMTFSTPKQRDTHIESSHGSELYRFLPYVPPIRSPISPSENIQSRLQQLLKGQASYKCLQCEEEFVSSADINKHKRYCGYIVF